MSYSLISTGHRAMRELKNEILRGQLNRLWPYDNQMYVHLKRITSKCTSILPLTDPTGNVVYYDEQKGASLPEISQEFPG